MGSIFYALQQIGCIYSIKPKTLWNFAVRMNISPVGFGFIVVLSITAQKT